MQNLSGGTTLRIRNQPSTERGEGGAGSFQSEVTVERITVLGLATAPKAVAVEGAGELTFYYDANAAILTIRKPAVLATGDWTISVAF